MKLGRVFIKYNSMTPTDPLAFIGTPNLFTPKDFDEIHLSCVFTWDKTQAEMLREAWRPYARKVLLGGPAYNDPGDEFTPGLYIRKGITITSRGCIFKCPWCFVPKREGNIRELKIQSGNEIQDNNLLACSKPHIQKVFEMLKTQKAIRFLGGLDARLLKDWHIDAFRSLRIKELWFACDTPKAIKNIERISLMLKDFYRNQKHCYVLIGDDYVENENRLMMVYRLGFLPFAQLYRNDKNDIVYDKKWRDLARTWSRPAIMKTKMLLAGRKEETDRVKKRRNQMEVE